MTANSMINVQTHNQGAQLPPPPPQEQQQPPPDNGSTRSNNAGAAFGHNC